MLIVNIKVMTKEGENATDDFFNRRLHDHSGYRVDYGNSQGVEEIK